MTHLSQSVTHTASVSQPSPMGNHPGTAHLLTSATHTPASSNGGGVPHGASSSHHGNHASSLSESEDEYESEEEEGEPFILLPIVRPDLADEWVSVTRAGTTYFVNYARNQSSWAMPPGF